MIKNIRNDPAVKVDNLLLAPDFTLITDCPIMEQPPIPPKKPVMIFAIPWPRDSLFLLLKESVASSTILAVSKLSTKPTIAMDRSEERRVGKERRWSGEWSTGKEERCKDRRG